MNMNLEKTSQKHTTSSASSRSRSSSGKQRSRSGSQKKERKTEKTESTDERQESGDNVKCENQAQQGRKHRQFTFIKDLPKRPERSVLYKQETRETRLVTNNFQVNYRKNGLIVVYSVKFTPFIDPQNNNLKKEVIRSQQDALKEQLGCFVYYANTIIGGKESAEFQFKLQKPIIFENVEYFVEIRKLRVVHMEDLQNTNSDEAEKPLMFFNYLIKAFFKNLNYLEHGKTRKFHDVTRRKQIPETELSILPGFAVNFQTNQSGFSFKIDVSHRIIRTTTALQYIDQIWREQCNKLQKDELRKFVSHHMTKQLVLANYGTHRTYQIDDLLFDQNTAEFSVEITDSQGKPVQTTLDQYFKTRYNYDIKNKKAPLIVIDDQKHQKKMYLVPEICIMAGVPENLSEFTRKQIQKECQTNPKDRFEQISKMLNELVNRQHQDGLTMEKLRNEFGIEIVTKPQLILGKQLKPPNILFGNQKVFPQGDKENFSFNCNQQQAFIRRFDVKISIISPPEFNCDEFKKSIEQNIKNYGIRIVTQIQCLYLSGGRNVVPEIDQTICQKIDPTTSLIVIVFNRQMKNLYGPLKKMCMSEKFGVVTQMVNCDNISKTKKGVFSIIQKIAMQMMDKVGNCIWSVQLPQTWPEHTMIISVIIEKGQFAGMLSSIDKNYSRFYSQMTQQIVEKSLVKDIGELVKNAFQAYQKEVGSFPSRIIYFRDGLNDESISRLLQYEKREILTAANQMSQFGDQMIIINIQNTNITKLFRDENGQLFNASAGTVVDHTITTKNYEFILVPVFSSRGCPKPILYRVIYDTIRMPMELLQDFVYGQCYNYQNWTGPIKLPAIVKNCQKMIKFVVDFLQSQPINKLKASFYYL